MNRRKLMAGMAVVFLVSVGVGYFAAQTPVTEEQELEPKPPDNRT